MDWILHPQSCDLSSPKEKKYVTGGLRNIKRVTKYSYNPATKSLEFQIEEKYPSHINFKEMFKTIEWYMQCLSNQGNAGAIKFRDSIQSMLNEFKSNQTQAKKCYEQISEPRDDEEVALVKSKRISVKLIQECTRKWIYQQPFSMTIWKYDTLYRTN